MKTKSQLGKAIRRRGHNLERDTVNGYKKLGYTEACTTRYGSRKLDDACVDVMNVEPFNPQCKATNRQVNVLRELAKMPQDTNYNVVHNKVTGVGTFVAMSEADWYEIVGMLKSNKII